MNNALMLSRIGDICVGICTCCKGDPDTTGVIVTGSETITCEESNVSRIGDIVVAPCGHTGVIITGASTATSESELARIGDFVTGCLEMIAITGADTASCQTE